MGFKASDTEICIFLRSDTKGIPVGDSLTVLIQKECKGIILERLGDVCVYIQKHTMYVV